MGVGMAQRTITSADAIFLLSIDNVYPVFVELQDYSADDAFSADNVAPTEAQMGVDGHLSVGQVSHPVKMKIRLAADSVSAPVFADWYRFQQSAREAFVAMGQITLRSTGVQYDLYRGALTGYTPIPAAKKVLQPLEYEITWESVTPAEM
jgi:hypothetical protein